MNALNHIISPLDKYDNITDLLYLEELIESQKVIPTVERCFERDQNQPGLRQLRDIRRNPPAPHCACRINVLRCPIWLARRKFRAGPFETAVHSLRRTGF